MTTVSVQEVTSTGLLEPKSITVAERSTYDRIQRKLREVLQTDVVLLNKDIFDNIDVLTYSSTTFKYYRAIACQPDADSIVCRDGTMLSVKHESIGQVAETEAGHEELNSEECATLLARLPIVEDAKPVLTGGITPPSAEKILPDKSAPKPKDRKNKNVEKPLKVTQTYADYSSGQSLSLDFNQPVQQTDLQVKSTPELPAGKWQWINETRASFAGERFPGSTEYKLVLGPIVLKDGTKVEVKDKISFTTATVQINGVYVENTKDPLIMVVFNQRVNPNIPTFCTNVALKPYTPTTDIRALYRTASIISAYETAVEEKLTVLFFKPERWPISGNELEFVINSGSHSAEGTWPTRGMKHNAYMVSPFTIRPMQWTQVPCNCVLGFMLSQPLHPDCVAKIRKFVRCNVDINNITVAGDRVYVDVPHTPSEFTITFDKSLMSASDIILGADFARTYKKYQGQLCAATSNQKITNVDKPVFQLLVSALTTNYSIYDAEFSSDFTPLTKDRLGGATVTLEELPSEMQIVSIDLENYFTPTRKLVAVIVENQGTFYVQKTDWMVDAFAHEHGVEVSVYTKDLQPLNKPTFYCMDKTLVTVKGGSCLPLNITAFKAEADGESAVFNMPAVTIEQGNNQKIEWYTTSDRGLYQPNERAHIVGFARDENGALPKGQMRYVVKDGHGTEICKQNLEQTGPSFELNFDIPSFAHPGQGEVVFFYSGVESHRMNLPIREFRIPDNELQISSAQDTTSAMITTELQSFIGDDVTGATTTGDFVVKSGTLSLPQYPGFNFYTPHEISLVSEPLATIKTELGASSRVRSVFNVNNSSTLVSIEYKAESRLKNGDRLTGSHVASFRPRGLAVGLKIKREQEFSAAFPFSFEAVVIDENNAVVNGVNVVFELWSKSNQTLQLAKQFVQSVQHGESIPVSVPAGEFIAQAYVADGYGHVTSTRSEVFHVSNDAASKFPVKVALENTEYAANETAKLDISNLPSFFTRGLCNIYVKGRELVKLSKPLENSADFTMEIPLKSTMGPRALVYCSIIGFGTSTEGLQTQLNLFGLTTLNIKNDSDAKFSMEISKSLEPSEKSRITCQFEEPLREDVNLTVWAVDDAVLKLAKFVLTHPHDYFSNKKLQYAANALLGVPFTKQQRGWTGTKLVYVQTLTGKLHAFKWTKDTTLLQLKTALNERTGIPIDQVRLIHFGKQLVEEDVTLEQQGVLAGAKIYMVLRLRGDGGGGGSSSPAAENTPLVVRKSAGPLAFFKTVSVEKGSKTAGVEFEAPTDLKRFKVFALAVGVSTAAKQESVFNVTKPFSMTALELKHLCINDWASFPVTLYNRQDREVAFKVAARATSITVSGARGFSGIIKANSNTSVEFKLHANEYRDGTIQLAAVSRVAGGLEHSDAVELPVKLKTLSLRRNAFGRFDESRNIRAHMIDINEHILGTGEVTVNLSPSILNQGVEALKYLGDYRYMCSEQTSSQMLVALQYLTLGAFVREKGQKTAKEVKESIAGSVKALQARHLNRGMFSYWGGHGESYKHVNIQVTHALAIAQKEGFNVDSNIMYCCKENLKSIIESANTNLNIAYAAYVLQLLNEPMKEFATKLKEVGKTTKSLTSLAFLAAVPETDLLSTLVKRIGDDVSVAAANSEENSYWGQRHKLLSAIILALIENKPRWKKTEEELMSQTLRALLRGRVNGHWMSTNENMWSLTALAQYHQRVEKQVKDDFKVKVWLSNTYLGEMTAANPALKLRFDESLAFKALPQVTLQLTGTPVWYSVQLKLDSRAGEKPKFARFNITRRLYGLEKDSDVLAEQKNGHTTYRVKHGAYVGVEVYVSDSCYSPVRFFAVQDPVAAGFEPLDVDKKLHFGYRLISHWSHVDVRRDGVDAFADEFYSQGRFAYKALALRKGTYTMPSCHVEEMYNAENFTDSETATVIIE